MISWQGNSNLTKVKYTQNHTQNRFIPFQGFFKLNMDTLLSLVISYISSSSYPLTLIQCNYYQLYPHYVFISRWEGGGGRSTWKIFGSLFWIYIYIYRERDHVLLTYLYLTENWYIKVHLCCYLTPTYPFGVKCLNNYPNTLENHYDSVFHLVVMLSYTGLSRVITGTTAIIICIRHVEITLLINTGNTR